MTLLGSDGEPHFTSKPRTFKFENGDKIAGFGQRTFNPHTTRRRSQFMACDRCHSVGSVEDPENAVLLDITFGFGSQRFPQEACDVTNDDPSCGPNDQRTYQLDAIQSRDGDPMVVVGHPDPLISRPLSLEEIDRMRQVLVPSWATYRTDIPPDAATDPNFPYAKQYDNPTQEFDEEGSLIEPEEETSPP